MQILHELLPSATRIAVLVNSVNTVNVETTLKEVGMAGRSIGLQIQVLKASTIREINEAFETFVSERPDAFFHRRRPVLQQPTYPVGPSRHPPWGSSIISRARLCGSRWSDELWSQYCGCLAT